MSDHQRRIDRVLDPAYLEGIGSRPDAELHDLREECTEVETEYSYLRRLAQGRIAILEAERDRRSRGGDLSELVAALPEILADDEPRPGPARSRLPLLLAPKKLDGYSRGMERLVEDDTLAKLPDLDDEELGLSITQLTALEQEVSDLRRRLHDVIDAIGEELRSRRSTRA